MDSYILGSGIMDHPYVWVFFLLISVGCLFGVLSVRELERHPVDQAGRAHGHGAVH